MANPEYIQECLQETKDLLAAVIARSPDSRLTTCLGNIEKVEALMKGDYETAWRKEVEQRKRLAAESNPLTAALRAIKAHRTSNFTCIQRPVPAAPPTVHPGGDLGPDEDLYS